MPRYDRDSGDVPDFGYMTDINNSIGFPQNHALGEVVAEGLLHFCSLQRRLILPVIQKGVVKVLYDMA